MYDWAKFGKICNIFLNAKEETYGKRCDCHSTGRAAADRQDASTAGEQEDSQSANPASTAFDANAVRVRIYSRHHALEKQGEGGDCLCCRVCHVQAPCVPAYTYCRAGCSGRRFLRFSCVLPCTRLSTIKSYNIRFPGRRISRNPCKTRAKRIL